MKIRAAALLAVVLLLVSAPSLLAQEVTASITGRITDPQGGAMVGAAVSMKDIDRGTDWPTKTNGEGIYAFPRLPVGNYTLKVEAPGFKTSVKTGIRLEVNLHTTFDVTLQVGATSESISVTGETPLLQTDNNQVGGVISSATISNMPLISRNPVALTLLSAGVTTPDPSSFNNGLRSAGGGRPYVNGNREEANNFMLDGVDNNLTSENQVSYQPNTDAIEEFRLITNNASAEFGNYQGGVINVVMKSGTNQFHGNVFEDFRNDKLNANNWANNWTIVNGKSIPRPPLRWNQYGGTFGGPIFKDKLFFFGDYQALRRDTPPSVSAATVMPLAWRTGDFSSLLVASNTANNKAVQLYNPFALNASTGLRDPFAGNLIPASLLSPAATKLLNNQTLYPAPQQNTFSTSNYAYGSSSQINTDQGDIKLDYRPNDKDYYSFRYSHGRQDNPGFNTFPLLYNSFSQSPFQNGVLNWTRTIRPNLVNEARFGANNVMLNTGGADKGLGNIAQSAGIQAAGAGLMGLQGFTYITGLGNANVGTQQLFANTTWQLTDNLTWIKSRHVIKVGADEQRRWINAFYAGNNGRTGFIDFNGRFTAQNAASPTGTQIGEADFMLGLPDQLGRGLNSGTWGQRSWVTGIFIQDDYKVTKNLTLNLGLRWQYNTPWVEVENRMSNFGLISGQQYIAGQSGCPYSDCRALYNSYKKDFQPRIGFAYVPEFRGKKVVIRGGYAISSYLEGTGTNLRLTLNPPFGTEFQTYYNTPAFTLPGTTLDQGMSQLNPKGNVGATIRLWDPNVRPAESQQWNLSTEYQFAGNNVLTVGYVGQHSTHLMVAMPYWQNIIQNGTVVPGYYLSGNPTLRGQIAQISGTCSCANQKYNGLQATMRKRFSAGFEYQVAFTYSHGMSDSIGYYGQGGQAGGQSAYMQNLYDRVSEWSPTYFDNKFNFVPSFVYQLPVGSGRKFGSNMNKVLDGVVGGWQLGGVFTAHTGFPLTIKIGSDQSGTGARSFRANVIGTPNDPHNIGPGASYLDVTAYSVPVAHTFGNAGPGIVRGPGMGRFDLSLNKQFHITERRYFELRGEAYNLANTPIFASPASQSIQSALFGQIRSAQGERNVQLVGKFYF